MIDFSQVMLNAYADSWYVWIGIMIVGYFLIKFGVNEKTGVGFIGIGVVYNIYAAIAYMTN